MVPPPVRIAAGLAVVALLWATSTLSVVTWQSPPPGTTAARTRFVNVAAAAGVTFVHRHSPTADKHYPESVPGGVAVFDYNGDGRPDIFFTNGAEMPTLAKRGDAYANRLYRNDGGMKFTDVTAAAGVSGVGYAMGAAAADYDNDGHVDLFVAGVARNQLLHNRGDGSFEDVTERSRIGSGEWAAAAGWFDYDNDGRLDLLVINYVRWSAARRPLLRRPGERRAHLLPSAVFRGPAESPLPQSRRRDVRGRLGLIRDRRRMSARG